MKKYSDVNEFLDDLDDETRKQVNALREIIIASIPVTEHIKWNAPSYVFDGEDRITFNVRGTTIKILIHMGATRPEDKSAKPVLADKTGIIKWQSNIRGIIEFEGVDDISFQRNDFVDILKRWVSVQ